MIVPTFNVNLEDLKANFFDRILDPVERMRRKNTEILAAQCRTAAQHSMRDVDKLKTKSGALKKGVAADKGKYGWLYSAPGNPPFARVGLIKKFILYAWNPSTHSAFIGPMKLKHRGNVPRSLEFGLPTLIESGFGKNRKVIQVPLKARPFMKPALDRVMAPANLKRVYEKSLKAQKGFLF